MVLNLNINSNVKVYINIAVISVIYIMITIYSLDIKIPYPKPLIIYFNQPWMKLLVYITLYFISYYNPIIALLAFIFVVILHTNDIMFVTPKM